MRDFISINQRALVENFDDLSPREGIILNWIDNFMRPGKMKTKVYNGITYYWINYQTVLDQNPLLKIKSKDSIYRSVKLIIANGILIPHPENQQSGKTYFAPGPRYDDCFNVSHGAKNGATFRKTTERPSAGSPNDLPQNDRTDRKEVIEGKDSFRANGNLHDFDFVETPSESNEWNIIEEIMPTIDCPIIEGITPESGESKTAFIIEDEIIPLKKEKATRKKPARKPGDPFKPSDHTQQEFMICKKTFEKYHREQYPGNRYVWSGKDNTGLRRLIGFIKQGMEMKGIEINNHTLYDNFSGFMNVLTTMRDGWFRQNHFTPANLASQFQNIINRSNDGKSKIDNLETQLTDYLNND